MLSEFKQRLLHHYGSNAALLDQIRQTVEPHTAAIAHAFYTEMLSGVESAPFLSSQMVDERLHASMARWISSLFAPRTESDVEQFLEWQAKIGHVHARINIPVRLFNNGMRLLKREISRHLLATGMERDQLAAALIATFELMDMVSEALNHSYMTDVVSLERDAQSLRMQSLNNNLAIECERMRSALFDWQRKTLITLYQHAQGKSVVPVRIEQSDFGLWLTHKGTLLFEGNPIVDDLNDQLHAISAQLNRCLQRDKCEGDDFGDAVHELNERVTRAGWLLGTVAEQTISMENSRDPLTRLLNRRYMPVVMQRETEVSLKHDLKFAVLFVDVDHFKKINDQFGHDAGDQVLRHVAEEMSSVVRSGDFLFRYGGEEFLVVLSDTQPDLALQVAERLRVNLSKAPYRLNDGRAIDITVSIGLAMHEGHPDYWQVIRRADAALYKAKSEGRNRVVVASMELVAA